MSPEFTREAVMKFLPAPFSWNWCKCLLRSLIHSKISNLTKYREVLVKYSLLITHADRCRNAALNLRPVTGTTNGFSFQIINSLIESWGVRLTWFDCNGTFEKRAPDAHWPNLYQVKSRVYPRNSSPVYAKNRGNHLTTVSLNESVTFYIHI